MTDTNVEQLIQDRGLTAARVTPAVVEQAIRSEHYFTAFEGVENSDQIIFDDIEPLKLLTFCVLILQNGYTVTGQSACASPSNFDPEVGRIIARRNAVDQIWPLLGYELRTKLQQGE